LEDRIRNVQAVEALEDLRRQLRLRTCSHKFKIANITGQGANTRAQEFLKLLESRIRIATSRYQLAYVALLALRGPGDWQDVLQPLHRSDVCGLSERLLSLEEKERLLVTQRRAGLVDADFPNEPMEPLPTVSTGEGRRMLSWIWYSVDRSELAADLAGNLNDSIRVEWVKSRARSARWEEEVALLEEEMRRVIAYSEWRAGWWSDLRHQETYGDETLRDGAAAYAAEHEGFELRFATTLKTKWQLVRARALEKRNGEGVSSSVIEVVVEGLDIEGLDDDYIA
jgi:hypothetical protein